MPTYSINGKNYPFGEGVTREMAIEWYKAKNIDNPNVFDKEKGQFIETNLYNNTLGTLSKSGKQFAIDMAQPIIHPIETAKSLFGLGSSLVNLFRKGEQGNEDIARAVGNYFAERYGGIENIKKTFRTDPVGFAADLSIILTGGATLVPKAAQTSGKVGAIVQKAVNAVKQTGQFIDPLNIPLKTAGVVKNYAVKPILGATADVISGAYKGTGTNTLRSYGAGKAGGNTQEAFVAGRGGTVENIPLVGKYAAEKLGLDNKNVPFTDKIIEDIQNLKKSNLEEWNKSKAKLELKKVKMSKAEITKILKNAEKNGKMNGVWVNKADEKIFKTITDMKDEVFKANINRNGLGADTYVHRLNALLKNNKENKLIMEVRDNVKSNINSKSPNYNKVTEGFTEISKIENMADNILASGDPDKIIGNLKSIFRNNKTEKKLLNKLNPKMEMNMNAFDAGQNMSKTQGNIVNSIAKGTMGMSTLGPTGILLASATGPRVISGLANTLGKGRRAITPNQKIQTGLGTSARLARALQQKEDDTVFYGS